MKLKKTVSLLLTLTLILFNLSHFLVGAATTVDQVIYLDGVNGNDANSGTSKALAVATLDAAYDKLLSANQSRIRYNANSQGVILICGTVTVSANFNTNRGYTHEGHVLITSKYGSENYTGTAKLQFSLAAEQAIQLGGPTELNHITLNRTVTNAYVFYAVKSLAVGANVINQYNGAATTKSATQSSMQGKFIVRGGYYNAAYTGNIDINIQGGTYWFVSGANATSGGAVNGDVDITIGGSAWVATVVPGTQNAASNIPSSKITVEGSATVNSITASGDNGNIADSQIVLTGGTVNELLTTRSDKTGTVTNFTLTLETTTAPSAATISATTKTLVLSDIVQSMSLASDWNQVSVMGNSTITLTNNFPTNTDLAVDYGSRLNLNSGDSLSSWSGCGIVSYGNVDYQNPHVEGDDIHIEPTCTEQGYTAEGCTNCDYLFSSQYEPALGHDWNESTDICTRCGASKYVVFVDGTVSVSGEGYTEDAAVKTLEEAYTKLLSGANNKLINNATSTGTIVLSGEVILDGQHFNLDGTYQHQGEVTLTSVYGGTDYRQTKDARLAIGSYDASTETRFQCAGPTVFEDITIHRLNKADGSAGTNLTFYGANSLVMGEGVETTNTNWNMTTLPAEMAAQVKLSAHMGYQTAGPANSIPSFEAAGQLGFWSIETDVRVTKDGVLVCIHDATIDGTTNGSGSVANMTLAELRQYQLDTGNNLDRYSAEELRIPLFSEYLALCKEYGALPFIEVKTGSLSDIINEARQYFDDEDIIVSSSSFTHLQQARAVSTEVFIHHIFSSESQISALSALGNSGMAFNYTAAQLQDPTTRELVRGLINSAHAANVQVCLRAGDDIETVRTMMELGVDYIPTNTTTPPSLLNPSYSTGSGGKIFIRGGYGYKATNENVNITLLSGQYDFVAASNAEYAANGQYNVTVGGDALVSRLVTGATCSQSTTISQSQVTVDDNAIVRELYTVGDFGVTTTANVLLPGGKVEALNDRRSGKTGTGTNLTVTLKDQGKMPDGVSLASSTITGARELVISGITGQQMAFDPDWTKVTLKDNSSITLVGTFPTGVQLVVETGSSLITP